MLRLCSNSASRKPAREEPFIVGVNYWPRQIGRDFWRHFDVNLVHEDFSLLSEIGISYARVFLSWEDFQSEPDQVRCRALSHLMDTCDAAAAENIKLELVLSQGQMGRLDGVPSFIEQAPGAPHPFSDPVSRDAAQKLFQAIARAVGGHSAIAAYNLGDYSGTFALAASHPVAQKWLTYLASTVRAIDTKHAITAGFSGENLRTEEGLQIHEAALDLDYCTLEPQGLLSALNSRDAIGTTLFGCSLAVDLAQKPCQLQELTPGFARDLMPGPERDLAAAKYVQGLLSALVKQGARGAVLWWSADPLEAPGNDDEPQPYGLIDAAGNLRPHGQVLQDFARTNPTVPRASEPRQALVPDPKEYYAHPEEQLESAWARFRDIG